MARQIWRCGCLSANSSGPMVECPTTQTNKMQGSVLSDISIYVTRKQLLHSPEISLVNRLAFTKEAGVFQWTFVDEYAMNQAIQKGTCEPTRVRHYRASLHQNYRLDTFRRGLPNT